MFCCSSQQHIQKRSKPCRPHSTPARAQAQAQAEAPLAPVEQEPSRSGFLSMHMQNVIMTCQTEGSTSAQQKHCCSVNLTACSSLMCQSLGSFVSSQTDWLALQYKEEYYLGHAGFWSGARGAGNNPLFHCTPASLAHPGFVMLSSR